MFTFPIVLALSDKLSSQVDRALDLLEASQSTTIQVLGGEIMFTVPDDQANQPYSISPVTATDKEGNALSVVTEFISDNPDVVAINGDANGGELVFGKPGVASLVYKATAKSGKKELIVKTAGAQFTVTTGEIDPASVGGGELSLPGLTEDEAPAPTE